MRGTIASGLLSLLVVVWAQPTRANAVASLAEAELNDRGEFSNPIGDLDKGGLGVRLPFMLRRLGTYFRSGDGAAQRVPNDGSLLRANVADMTPMITWVGHSTFVVQMGGMTFLTDPIWSNTPSPVPALGPRRFVQPGIAISDLPAIDFVTISHNHYDHLDLPTLRTLAERDPDTVFLVPEGNGALLRSAGIGNVTELNWGQRAELGAVTVHCLPTQHWSKRSLTDTNKSLWSSWAVIGPDRRFYHAGDTGYFSGFKAIGKRLGPFDLAAIPIGAYTPRAMMKASHINPEEAVTTALDLAAQSAVGMHFGTFDLSDESLDEPPRRFLRAAEDQGLGEENAWVLKIGENRRF